MYCSQECMDEDENKYHEFDCVTEPEDDMDCHDVDFKMLCEVLFEFNWKVEETKNFLTKEVKNVFDLDMSDPKTYKKNLILASLNMHPERKHHSSENLQFLKAFKFSKELFLMRHPTLKELIVDPQHGKYMLELLAKLFHLSDQFIEMIMHTNIDMRFEADEPCNGAFILLKLLDPYRSLTRHSCIPNVHVQYLNGKCAWIVLQPVPAGTTITINLLPTGLKWQPRKERKEFLYNRYKLRCKCDVCKFDWNFLEEKSIVKTEDMIKFLRAILYSPLSRRHRQESVKGIPHVQFYTEAIEALPEAHEKVPCREYWFYETVLMKAANYMAFPKLFEE